MDTRTLVTSIGVLVFAALANFLFPPLFGIFAFIILTIVSIVIYIATNGGREYNDGVLPISPSIVAYGSILLLLVSLIVSSPNLLQILIAISGIVLISTGLTIYFSNYPNQPQWWNSVALSSYWLGGALIAIALIWNIGMTISTNQTVRGWINQAEYISTERSTTEPRNQGHSVEEIDVMTFPNPSNQLWCFRWKRSGASNTNVYGTRIDVLNANELSFRYTSDADKQVIIRTERQIVPGKVFFSGNIVGTDNQVSIRMRNSFYFTGTSTVNGDTYELILYATEGVCR